MSEALRDAVTDTTVFAPDAHVLVACSGGVDSVVLAHAMWRYGAVAKLSLCYVDHGLHEHSEQQWRTVESLATTVGCAVYREAVDGARLRLGNGPEDGARQERYRCLEALRVRIAADCIALAHHADDQVETFLIRLSQGSGMHGLRGMESVTSRLRRPLLRVRKSELEVYASSHELPITPDPTNASNLYLRNAIRNQLRPHMDKTLGEHWMSHVLNLMDDFTQRSRLDECLAARLFESSCRSVEDGVLVPRSAFAQLLDHEKYLLARACLSSLAEDGLVRRDHIERLLSEVEESSPTHRLQLSESLWILGEYERVYVGRDARPMPVPTHVERSGEYTWGDWRIGVDQALDGGVPLHIPTALSKAAIVLRGIGEGESLKTRCGTKKISRLLIDAKVPRRLRTQVLLVESEGDVFWCWMPSKSAGEGVADGSGTTLWIRPPEEFRRRG